MTLIIAEAGVNHNGDEQLARQLIDVAKSAGADIVKFQTFKAAKLATSAAAQAQYQTSNSGVAESQLSMLSKLELSFAAFRRLADYCQQQQIEFLSTAFDDESLDFLVNELNLQRLKIPSGEINNAPFLLRHAQTGRQLILSTGMATLADIEAALGVLAFGYTAAPEAKPSVAAFQQAYASASGQQALKDKVTLLHCTSEYPTPLSDVNLRAMDTLCASFGLAVGLSDHSAGTVVSIAAAARGACVIEKHFTLDRLMEGPDHQASLSPDELHQLIHGVRQVEQALGSRVKTPQRSELKNKAVIRKSLVAARDIEAGELLSADCIAVMRPEGGASPFKYWEMQSIKASRSYKAGEPLVD